MSSTREKLYLLEHKINSLTTGGTVDPKNMTTVLNMYAEVKELRQKLAKEEEQDEALDKEVEQMTVKTKW
jgi:hypothetical protein